MPVLGDGPVTKPSDLESVKNNFTSPPPGARPWVYWTWLDGNMNERGITADLEAMQRVGIGGALILDVAQGAPHGPVKFFDARWQALFKFAISEAKRLGMEINMNNGAGYYGSGGTWVPPDKAMQTVVQSEAYITGGVKWKGNLAKPSKNEEYRDIAVVAVAETKKSKYRIPDFTMKSLQWKTWIAYKGTESAPLNSKAPANAIIPLNRVIDLTGKMRPDGALEWDAPAGYWTIIRFGHAWNGSIVGPSPKGEAGPETDKLDKAATALHFNAFVKHLNDLVGPNLKDALVATHIDSWEGGGQNWTAAMREEFKRRRKYDPVSYLPILTGRVLGDQQITERFLYDLRQTVSELMIENYSAEFQRLSHEAGLRNTFESYTTSGNDLDNAQYVDEPMAEFWTPNGQGLDFQPTVKSMSSAAHIKGSSVVGAEAFTSGASEKFLWHPAMIKGIGDNAFCGGINRFVFHRYAAQPFAEHIKPGMQMGPWGLHYERTNTWWEFSRPWHEYLSRCQYLLRQGRFVADVLKLESEDPLRRFQDIKLSGYDYDACGPATFRSGRVQDGKFVFPSGMQYRLIILPSTPTMTIGLLTHIRDLVRDGAAVLGDPPQKTPGLTDYPQADVELSELVKEIWGTDPLSTDQTLGKGRVFRGVPAEKALAALGHSPDFTSDADIKYIHRKVNGAEVYFLSHAGTAPVIANCTFRVTDRQPSLWNPQDGTVRPIPAFSTSATSGTSMAIPFDSSGSGFVVFDAPIQAKQRYVDIALDGKPLFRDGMPATTQPSPLDALSGQTSQAGNYSITNGDGSTRRIVVPPLPEPMPVTGSWQLRFPPGRGASPQIMLDSLVSWSQHPDDRVKYFSGTATYVKTLTIPAMMPDQHFILELGNVQVMAKVRLNGKDLGILWKPPYHVDITAVAKAGENVLEIDVVNLWVNRLIGDEQLPEDSERNGDGTLKAWPKWLLDEGASPTGRITFSSWRLWKKTDGLQKSGLIGPVTVRTVQQIGVHF